MHTFALNVSYLEGNGDFYLYFYTLACSIHISVKVYSCLAYLLGAGQNETSFPEARARRVASEMRTHNR